MLKKALVSSVLLFAIIFGLDNTVTATANSSWVVIDADTGRLLDGHQAHEPLPIASLTKIWTALTFLESGVLEQNAVISSKAASAEGSSIYLDPHSEVPTNDLLHGLLLRSGNDAAMALAEHAGGSEDGFVQLMNDQADLYGLKNTHFTNPSGLHHDEHVSTAYDTAMMLYYGMKNKDFRKIASAERFKTSDKSALSWENKHRLLTSDPTAIAGKTGFTKVAGRTLATYFEYNGEKVIVVTLNNGNDWKVHQALADKVFREYSVTTIAKQGEYMLLPGVTAHLEKPIKVLLKPDEKASVSSIMRIPRSEHTKDTGQWIVSLNQEPLLTTEVTIHRE